VTYNPAFKPNPDLFDAQFNGSSAELYPSVAEAVIDLADNKKELIELRESLATVEEKKDRALRDVQETMQRIRELKAKEAAQTPDPEQAVAAGQAMPSSEMRQLDEQLPLQRKVYEDCLAEYRSAAEKWWTAVAKIKDQVTAFTPEQKALAQNIQTAIESARTLIDEATTLATLAGLGLGRSISQVHQEIQYLASQRSALSRSGVSPEIVDMRIKRLITNISTLPTNLTILKDELLLSREQTNGFHRLFEKRLRVASSNAR
jgi:predicted RNase H-like nuclease (RuvC/YqgF family)